MGVLAEEDWKGRGLGKFDRVFEKGSRRESPEVRPTYCVLLIMDAMCNKQVIMAGFPAGEQDLVFVGEG